MSVIVRRHSLKFHKYCAFCGKSTKLAILVTKGVTKSFATPPQALLGEYWALLGPYWVLLGPYLSLLGERF